VEEGVVNKRSLDRLLAKRLSGEEVARLILQDFADELAGQEPTFSEAEIEQARTTLRGRPQEVAIFNAWMEVPRIIEFVSMDALAKALEAEKALSVLTLSVVHLLRLGSLRKARQAATKVLTPEEWETFPARREKARRARIAKERVSLAEVIRLRAWRVAPEAMKDGARALPYFEEHDGNGYDCLLEIEEAPTLALCAAAEAEIAMLVDAGRLRFVREGRDVSAVVRANWREGLPVEEAEALEDEAECSLLELVGAGLPEWVEYAKAAWLTPAEFRGPVAVLQEIPPACLDGEGRFVEPGWRAVKEALRREATPEKLEQLRSAVDTCQVLLRAFLARRAIIEVFGRELGLDLLPPMLREREEALRGLLSAYNPLATLSQEGKPDEDGIVPPDWILPDLTDLRLASIDVETLELGPRECDLLREALAVPDAQAWWEVALEVGAVGALASIDAPIRA
jgi:hypothetical protein